MNEEYVNTKMKEKLESITIQWKKDINEKILQEIRGEIDEKFENIMKDYEENDDEMLDIRGHGQRPEY